MKLLSLAVLATQAFALFENVEKLDASNFEEMVINDDEHLWMVTFYADWCPYCEPFAPEYEAAQNDTELANKKVKFGAVNVMENRNLTQDYEVKRSPTVKIFGIDKHAPEEYSGHRKRSEIVKYINDYAEKHDYIAEPEGAKYFYNIESIVKTIAAAHDGRIQEVQKAHSGDLKAVGEQGTQDL